MSDLPDFTSQNDVDIVAQTLATMTVNIVAQTLAALKINITAQDLSQLIINIAGQTAGLSDRADYSTLLGSDKSFEKLLSPVNPGNSISITYVVPGGKTLFIVSFAALAFAQLTEDADNNQICYGAISDDTLFSDIWIQGGNGGFSSIFNKPISIPSGHQVSFGLYNPSNHPQSLGLYAAGFEV